MSRTAVAVSVVTPAPDGLRHDRPTADPSKNSLLIGLMRSKVGKASLAVKRRRSIDIMSYVGSNGSGKTLCMVNDTLPSLDAGRTVYSTVPLFDPETGLPHPSYVPFRSWQQLLEAEHADVLMDEIIGVASSRESSSLHAEVQNRLNQLRKADLKLRWTAPAWPRADKIIREVTQSVTECAGFLSERTATDGDDAVMWAPRRLFRFRTYDMRSFDEWSAGKRERVRPDIKQWFQGPGSRAFDAYRTLDAVERVEPYDPNKCEHCGLKKRQETCRGHNVA